MSLNGRSSAFLFLQALMMIAMLLLGACKPSETKPGNEAEAGVEKDSARVRVMVVADNLRTPLRNYQMQLLNTWIRSRPGVDVAEFNAADNAAAQAQQLRTAMNESVDVLLVFPLLADGVMTALREAKAAGIHIVLFGSGYPQETFTTAITTDDRKIGEMAGDFVAQALTQKAHDEGYSEVRGRVVQLRGDEEGGVSEAMAEGFGAALQKMPGIVLVHDAPGNWNEAEATLRMQEALRLQKPFHVVFAHNDLMALGAAKTAVEDGLRDSLLIVGVDGAPGAQGGMEMVRRGEIEATLYRPPLVDVAWSLLQQWLDDRDFSWPSQIRVQPFLMTQAQAAQHTGRGLPEPVME